MEYTGYLFASFAGEHLEDGEQIYFSLSRDGLHWQDLNGGKPVLTTNVGECGARDPFVIRMPKNDGGNKYYLIATDLRIYSGKGWEIAQYSASRSLLVWESDDLVKWEGPVMHELAVEGAGCLWAPEAIYDEKTDSAMIFFASMVERKQRIYRTFTKDFRTFSPVELYLEKDNHVIDTTMIKVEDTYYRYSKDETEKIIMVEKSHSLNGPFDRIHSEPLDTFFGVEGPEIFKFNDRDEWCLIVDRFATGKGYIPMVSDDLSTGKFRILDDTEFNFSGTLKRHGGIIAITEDEYQALSKKY